MGPKYPADIDELRRLVQEGIDSGQPVDGPLAMKRLLAKLEIASDASKAPVTQASKS
jgi:hypothetical protein